MKGVRGKDKASEYLGDEWGGGGAFAGGDLFWGAMGAEGASIGAGLWSEV